MNDDELIMFAAKAGIEVRRVWENDEGRDLNWEEKCNLMEVLIKFFKEVQDNE